MLNSPSPAVRLQKIKGINRVHHVTPVWNDVLLAAVCLLAYRKETTMLFVCLKAVLVCCCRSRNLQASITQWLAGVFHPFLGK